MTRYLIGALSGWKYPDRRDRCQETWMAAAAAIGIDSVFLLGCPEIGRPQRYGHALCLPCADDYPTLPQRTRLFCQWALGRDDWDYLFKCDDDTFVAVARLAAYDPAGRAYIGAEWQAGVNYGSGGGGYLLSRQAAAIVAERLTQPTGAEDLLVGELLRAAGVPLTIEPRLIPFGNWDRRPKADNDFLTVHGVQGDIFMACHTDLLGETQR